MYDRLTEVKNIYAEPFAAENYLFFSGAQAYPLTVIFEHAVESVYARLAPAEKFDMHLRIFSRRVKRVYLFIMSAAERIFPLSLRFGMCIPLFPNNVCSPGNKKNAG